MSTKIAHEAWHTPYLKNRAENHDLEFSDFRNTQPSLTRNKWSCFEASRLNWSKRQSVARIVHTQGSPRPPHAAIPPPLPAASCLLGSGSSLQLGVGSQAGSRNQDQEPGPGTRTRNPEPGPRTRTRNPEPGPRTRSQNQEPEAGAKARDQGRGVRKACQGRPGVP